MTQITIISVNKSTYLIRIIFSKLSTKQTRLLSCNINEMNGIVFYNYT